MEEFMNKVIIVYWLLHLQYRTNLEAVVDNYNIQYDKRYGFRAELEVKK